MWNRVQIPYSVCEVTKRELSYPQAKTVCEMTNETAVSPARSPLLPDRHPQRDLFVCDIVDAVPKGDMASLEHPVFTLSTKLDMTPRPYRRGDAFS